MWCRRSGAECLLFLANFRFLVVGVGTRAYHIVRVLSEALISPGDWKYRHVWPFLFLGLGIAPGYCLERISPLRFSLALSPLAAFWKERGCAGLFESLGLGCGMGVWGGEGLIVGHHAFEISLKICECLTCLVACPCAVWSL